MRPHLSAARGNIDMIDPAGIKKINKYTMTVKLTRPWSETSLGVRAALPVSIIKAASNGTLDGDDTFIGTGAFKLTV